MSTLGPDPIKVWPEGTRVQIRLSEKVRSRLDGSFRPSHQASHAADAKDMVVDEKLDADNRLDKMDQPDMFVDKEAVDEKRGA